MTVGRDRTHILIVTEIDAEEGDWLMEIEHLPDCPEVVEYDTPFGHVVRHDCPTGRNIAWAGFEDFERPDVIGAGRHPFHLWWSGPDYLGEYDGGIEMEDGQ